METTVKSRGPSVEGRGVQSVEIGTRLLMALASQSGPMMLKDLAAAAGLVAAQAHPYLVSYRQQGMVERDPETGRYRLGRFALELGLARMTTADPLDVAYQSMRDLSIESGMSVILSVWGSFGPTIVNIVEGTSQLYMSSRVGTVYSLSGTATGLIFSAHLPESQLSRVKASEKRAQDRALRVGQPVKVSKSELQKIREQGYSLPPTPVVPGILALAAPVFDLGGQLQFAMALIGRGESSQTQKFEWMRDSIVQSASDLSARLGYFPSA